MNYGMIGGIIGGVIGVFGGLAGTYFSIKNTSGPKEKSFMIKCALIGWAGAIIFITLLLSLPKPYNFLLWIPYGIGLPFSIVYLNKKQRQIIEQEKNAQK